MNFPITDELKWEEIPHGRIYKVPLKGPNPRGMSAYCDRLVFCDYGYKVIGGGTCEMRCVPLDPNDEMDQMKIKWQEMEKRMDKYRFEMDTCLRQ